MKGIGFPATSHFTGNFVIEETLMLHGVDEEPQSIEPFEIILKRCASELEVVEAMLEMLDARRSYLQARQQAEDDAKRDGMDVDPVGVDLNSGRIVTRGETTIGVVR